MLLCRGREPCREGSAAAHMIGHGIAAHPHAAVASISEAKLMPNITDPREPLTTHPSGSPLPACTPGLRPITVVRGATIEPLRSTRSRPSAFAVGTALHAPQRPLTDATRTGPVGWETAIGASP